MQVPTPVLSRALKLTASQRARVDALQRQFRERVRAAFRPPAPGGPPPDPQAFRASITRVRGLEQATSAKIVALLSKDQKRSLARLLSDIGDFRVVGFPPDAGSVLTLSAKQRQRIGAIAARTRQASQKAAARARSPWEAGPAMMQARQRAHSDALAVLTGAQRSALERARRERRPFGAGGPFGAPGRPGPFGGRGGPGGPPPPRQAPL